MHVAENLLSMLKKKNLNSEKAMYKWLIRLQLKSEVLKNIWLSFKEKA